MKIQAKEKIQNISGAVKDFSDLIASQDMADQAPGLGMDSDAQAFQSMAEDIRKGIFKILALGEFKTGKSTLINALIGKDTVPTKTTACTAIITIVLYGSRTDRAFVYMSGKAEPVEMSQDAFFEKYKLTPQDHEIIDKQGYIDRFEDVEYAVVESQHPIFADGVRLVDSPGLAEGVSRTKATMNFVPNANAIIFLLNATRIFSKDEKEYIKHNYLGKCPRNVFFVVNRINQINGPLSDIKESTNYFLKPVFTDSKGVFDKALYESRVYYVDAYGAYLSKLNGDDAAIQNTDIARLESDLDAFLASDERVAATFQSTLTAMANTYKSASLVIANAKKSLHMPLQDLKRNHIASENILKDLDSQIHAMRRSFETASVLVQTKVYQDLIKYVTDDLPQMWEKDAETNETKFGVGEVLKLAWATMTRWNKEERAKKQQEIIEPLAMSIQKYISQKLDEWGNTTDTLIAPEIDMLKEDISDQVEQINLGLSTASRMFAGELSADRPEGKSANLFQLGLSLIQGDASVFIENAAGMNFSWGEWIKKYAVQAIMQIMIFSIFTGGVGFVVWLGMEIVQVAFGANRLREKLLLGMSGRLFGGLRDTIRSKENDIKYGIAQKFEAEFTRVSEKTWTLIDEEKNRQNQILASMDSQRFDIEKACKRMDETLDRMYERIGAVYYEIYGENMDDQAVDAIAKVS